MHMQTGEMDTNMRSGPADRLQVKPVNNYSVHFNVYCIYSVRLNVYCNYSVHFNVYYVCVRSVTERASSQVCAYVKTCGSPLE